MNANDTTDAATPDAPTMRRVAAELVADAPAPASWESIVARADGDEPASLGPAQLVRTSASATRPLLLAAATVAVLVLGVAALALRDRGGTDVGPADDTGTPPTDETPTPTTEVPAPTTTTELFTPSPTPLDDGIEQQPTTTTTPDLDESPEVVEEPIEELEPAEEAPAVELVTTPLGEITRLPAEAWVVPTTTPAGFRPLYAVEDGPRRRVVYRDDAGNDLTILIDPVGFEFGDPVEINGQTWLFDSADPERATLQIAISLTIIEISAAGLDVETARPIIESLVAGDDSVLPVEALRPSPDYRRHDLLAQDPDEASTTMRGFGVDGWYCLETAYPLGSSPNCGDGRDGELSSELRVDVGGNLDDDEAGNLTLSSIVSPEVATVEIVFTDGTTFSAVADDPTGRYDDRFWIVTTTRPQPDDPFQDRSVSFEARLLSSDGTVLGLAPLPIDLLE